MSIIQPLIRPLIDHEVRGLFGRGNGGGTDADALAWAAAVTGAGGTYSAGTLAAVSTFCASAKASGYWTKLLRINLFCGDQLAAALVPLKVGGGSATDTNTNFVGGDYTESTGITGNGTTKFLNTGLLASALTANDTHLSVYNRSSTAAAGGVGVGCIETTASTFRFFSPNVDGSVYSDQYNDTAAAGRVNGAVTTPYGHLVASRISAASHVIYRNASSIASNAGSGGTLPTRAIYVCASNSAGTASSFISQPLAAYSIGSGLSAADVTAYSTHMQTFQTALSRNV